jgi:hypothetical protein
VWRNLAINALVVLAAAALAALVYTVTGGMPF